MNKKKEPVIVSKTADLQVLGFRKIRDRYQKAFKIPFFAFGLFFTGVVVYSFYRNRFHIPGFEIICLAGMFLSIIGFGIILGLRRWCPECKKLMKKLSPESYDHFRTYKYYCARCMVYVDTNATNSYDGD